jgi:hypothetical protein
VHSSVLSNSRDKLASNLSSHDSPFASWRPKKSEGLRTRLQTWGWKPEKLELRDGLGALGQILEQKGLRSSSFDVQGQGKLSQFQKWVSKFTFSLCVGWLDGASHSKDWYLSSAHHLIYQSLPYILTCTPRSKILQLPNQHESRSCWNTFVVYMGLSSNLPWEDTGSLPRYRGVRARPGQTKPRGPHPAPSAVGQ